MKTITFKEYQNRIKEVKALEIEKEDDETWQDWLDKNEVYNEARRDLLKNYTFIDDNYKRCVGPYSGEYFNEYKYTNCVYPSWTLGDINVNKVYQILPKKHFIKNNNIRCGMCLTARLAGIIVNNDPNEWENLSDEDVVILEFRRKIYYFDGKLIRGNKVIYEGYPLENLRIHDDIVYGDVNDSDYACAEVRININDGSGYVSHGCSSEEYDLEKIRPWVYKLEKDQNN